MCRSLFLSTCVSLFSLVAILFCLSTTPTSIHVDVDAATPIAGAAGGAVLFDARRADIISGRWIKTPPTADFTLEFWYRMTDPYVLDGATFAYGAFDGSSTPGVEHPDELLIWIQQNAAYPWKNEAYLSCDQVSVPKAVNTTSCGGVGYYYGQWQHYSFVFSGTYKNVTLYKNGRIDIPMVLAGSAAPLVAGALLPDGIFSLGQDQDVLNGGYDQSQSLPAVMDEIRVWSYSRSPAQIAAAWDQTVAENSTGLNLYWRFDEWDAQIEPDRTGNGNDAWIGRIAGPVQEMSYNTPQPPRKPTPPRYVPSGAPLKAAQGPRFVTIASNGQPTPVILQAYDVDGDVLTCRITQLPTNGIVQSAAGVPYTVGDVVTDRDTSRTYSFAGQSYVVYYVPSASLSLTMRAASTAGRVQDSLQYSVSDSTVADLPVTGTVRLIRDRDFQPVNQTLELVQNTFVQVSLGGYDQFGNGLTAYITKLPTNGTLYLPAWVWRSATSKSQKLLISPLDPAKLIPITAAVPITQNVFGSLIYVPNKNAFSLGSVPLDVIEFRWITAVTADAPPADIYPNDFFWPLLPHHIANMSTSSATVSFVVKYVNSAPAPVARAVDLTSTDASFDDTAQATAASTLVSITLDSFDVDAALGYNAHPYYYVSTPPAFGKLYQYQSASLSATTPSPSQSNATGNTSTSTAAPAPFTTSSSPFSMLSSVVSLVPVNFELYAATSFDWVLAVRNVTDSFGSGGTKGRNTSICDGFFGCTPYWNAWGLLGPPNAYPVYGDSQFTYCPRLQDEGLVFLDIEFAHAMYIQGLEVYETLNPGSLVKVQIPDDGTYKAYATNWIDLWRGKSQIMPQKVNVATPKTCPEPIATNTVRIWLDTDIPGWQEIDAVKMFGTSNMPSGLISDAKGRVLYKPVEGVHMTNITDLIAAGINTTGIIIPAAFDQFSYYATDCQATSKPTTVTIFRPAPVTAAPDTLSQFATVTVSLTQDITTHIDLTQLVIPTLIQHVNKATAKSIPLNTTVAMSMRATPAAADDTSMTLTAFGVPATVVTPLKWSRAGVLSVTPSASQGSFSSFLWLSVQGYTYRVSLQFTMNCTGRSWSRAGDGVCVPCQDISSAQVDAMSAADSYKFLQICKSTYSATMSGRLVLVIIAAVAIVFAILIAAVLIVFRQAKAVKASSIMFMVLIMSGVAGLLATIFALYPADNSAACVAQVWLGHISFSVLFGSLLLKTYRLAHIFNNRKFHVRALSDKLLFKYLCAYLAVVCAILTAWMIISPPTIITRLQERTEYNECGSDKPIFKWILIGVHAALLTWGVYLCVISRKVYSELNESKHIAICIYNVALIAVILVAIDNAAKPSPDALFYIYAAGILLGCLVTMALIAGPKLHFIYVRRHTDFGTGDVTVNNSRLSNEDQPKSGSGSGNNTATTGNMRSSVNGSGDSAAVANSADWLKFGLFTKKMMTAIDAHRLDVFVNTHRGLETFLQQIKAAAAAGGTSAGKRVSGNKGDTGSAGTSQIGSPSSPSSPVLRKASHAPLMLGGVRKSSALGLQVHRGSATNIDTGFNYHTSGAEHQSGSTTPLHTGIELQQQQQQHSQQPNMSASVPPSPVLTSSIPRPSVSIPASPLLSSGRPFSSSFATPTGGRGVGVGVSDPTALSLGDRPVAVTYSAPTGQVSGADTESQTNTQRYSKNFI